MSTIRFARIKFERKLSHYTDEKDAIERRKELLLEVIDFENDLNSLLRGTDAKDVARRGEWYYGDVKADDNIISGKLGKAKEEIGHLPDKEREGFVAEEREDTDISFFVINLRESVMAYEYVSNIGKKAPFRILREAFNAYYGGEEEISISPLVDKQEVRKEIEKISFVSEISFSNLTPSNPDHTPTSKPMDDFLNDTKISRLHFRGVSDQRQNNPDGIDFEGHPILDGGLNLAEEGYGSAKIEGKTSSGEKKVVETGNIPIETKEELGESEKVNRKRLIESIREALDELE